MAGARGMRCVQTRLCSIDGLTPVSSAMRIQSENPGPLPRPLPRLRHYHSLEWAFALAPNLLAST